MKIIVRIRLPYDYKFVYERMNEDLFMALAPKGQMKLLRFDGSKKGDRIEIQMLRPWKSLWVSDVVHDEVNDRFAMFTDVGRQLPFGLKSWTHHHRILNRGENSCEIVEDITFASVTWLQGVFMYLPLYFSFRARKKKYKKFFLHQ